MKVSCRASALCKVVSLALIFASRGYAAADSCPSGAPIATFKLTITANAGGPALPVNSINIVDSGNRLAYEPVKIPKELQKTGRVSVLLIRTNEESEQSFEVLPARALKVSAEWPVAKRVSAIGLIVGPHGIDTKKVAALVEKHPEIVAKVSDYAAESSRVEALVQTLSQYEHSAAGEKSLQSVLQGFSAEYGVKLPALDDKSGSPQQALKMLQALAPAVSANDQLRSRSAMLSKTGGLAESVAAGYFGAPMVAAIGGVTLVDNLYSSLFPSTNIQSAFALPADSDAMMFCSGKPPDSKTRGRIDYLWISALPNEVAPQAHLTGDVHIPLGIASTVSVSTETVAQLGLLSRARDWQLVSPGTSTPVPVKVTIGASNDTFTLDLSPIQLTPGPYRLAAKWDWTPFELKGTVNLHAFGDLAKVAVAPDSQDSLIAGRGPVQVRLRGTDFEFVESVSLLQAGNRRKQYDLPLLLPKGRREGEQVTVQTEVDTSTIPAGAYLFAIKQQNGVIGNVPVTIHPPNPELSEAPLRANVGEPQQILVLHGKHLERIEKIVCPGAEWTLSAVPKGVANIEIRSATIKLDHSARPGDHLNVEIVVAGLQSPLELDDIVSVVGERPKITKATKSFASRSGIELRDGEIPTGGVANFVLDVQNVEAHPVIVLACKKEIVHDGSSPWFLVRKRIQHSLTLRAADPFFSLDPGVIGNSGCELVAQITESETGASDTFQLGRVIRLPRIDKFDISGEKLGDNTYAGTLTGQDLQLVEKTGWTTDDGAAVQGIPAPVPGNQTEQTLNIAMPWPPPAPKAPLYVWLRGESQARQTMARY